MEDILNQVSEPKRRAPGAFPEALSRSVWPKDILWLVVDHAIEHHETLEQVKSGASRGLSQRARAPLQFPMRITKNFHITLFAIAALSFVSVLLAQPQEVNALIEKADKLDTQEQTSAAIELLLQANNTSPNNPKILIRLSQDYSDQVDNAKDRASKVNFAKLSVDYAKRAIQEAPKNSDAHVALSIAYGKMCDFVDNKTKIEYSNIVKSEAEKSVELNPKNDTALLVLARWNFDISTTNPVLKGFAQALYGQIPPASKEKALDYFQRAIAVAPQRIIHHAEYAQALETLGRKDDAKAEWQKVRDLKPIDSRERQYQVTATTKLRSSERLRSSDSQSLRLTTRNSRDR